MMAAKPKMPARFGSEGKLLWTSITRLHELGPDAVRVLTDACREADIVQRLEDELRDSDLMVRGSQGQLVASPLVSEVRQHRAVLSGLLKAMKLPMTTSDAQRADELVSEQARAAARARWDKPRLVS
jgi:hypothetical protein